MLSDDLKIMLWGLEKKLSDPNIRSDAVELSKIMHDDFVEFGSSGRRFNKAEIIVMLTEEQNYVAYEIESFTCIQLSPSIAHITYIIPQFVDREGNIRQGSQRSSIWKDVDGQ